MKRIFVLICSVFLISCATMQQAQPPATANLKEDKYFTFNFNRWQSFFYTDEANSMVLMFQVKEIDKQPIPKEFQIKLADGTVKVMTLKSIYPEVKKP